jgi:hypothetical protein
VFPFGVANATPKVNRKALGIFRIDGGSICTSQVKVLFSKGCENWSWLRPAGSSGSDEAR